jgi:peptidoglycan/LPS O-acetylase OafA/YrhL
LTATAVTPTPTNERTGYRPEIDGLRTVAVLLVVAFHADIATFTGGFLGVDVFFVLSGFLITGLLVDEARRRTIDLGGFYARRSRRLLPAALVVIVATSIVWVLTASPLERQGLGADARAASLYYSNWHFAGLATDYFHQADSPSPFLHFWSLSAEEQFYFVWPALVAGAALLARRLRRDVLAVVRAVAVVLFVASLVSLWLTNRAGSDAYAYFATTNRVYQLLAGALLALHLRMRSRHTATAASGPLQVVAIAALFLLSTKFVDVGPTTRGLLVAATTVPLLWALDRSPELPVAKVLATRPFVWLGRISYGVYLWHWPVVLLLKKFYDLPPYQAAVVCTVITVAIAELSHRLIEQPIRASAALARHGRAVIVSGLATSAVVGLFLAPLVLAADTRPVFVAPIPPGAGQVTVPTAPGQGDTRPTGPREPAPSPDQLKALTAKGPGVKCIAQPLPKTCLMHRGSKPFTLAVLGDSHLEAFKEVFVDLAERHDITVYFSSYTLCPWLRGVYPRGKHPDCKENQETWYQQVLPVVQPDMVVTFSRAYDDPAFPHDLVTEADPNTFDPATVLEANWQRALDELLQHTEKVVVVQPWPSLSFGQAICLSTASFVDQCAGTAAPLPSDPSLRAVDEANDDVERIDLNPGICPRMPVCDAMVDGAVVRQDNNHLTYGMTVALEPLLERLLDEAGALGPAG